MSPSIRRFIFPTPNSLLLLLLLLLSSAAAADMPWAAAVAASPLLAFLQRLQSAALRTYGEADFDPKLYVDLPLKKPLSAAEEAFSRLPTVAGAIPEADLASFLSDHFGAAGSDLVHVEPEDFVTEPEEFLPKVENGKVRAWALEVHALWRSLTRKVDAAVAERPERHTLLPLPAPVVVPGSRFREVYYWDSYWSIRGLLASKMYSTAKAIVLNFISLIDSYDFVLNGARAYYTNRSQPPMLSAMVREIYKKTGDLELVKRSLPSLLKEHNFWNSDDHRVTIQDPEGHKHHLSRYWARWDEPRPESATIDLENASKLSTSAEKRKFFHQLATAAESGWDFSTRWMSDYFGLTSQSASHSFCAHFASTDPPNFVRFVSTCNSSDLTTLETSSIIPVDLNAFLYKMEVDIAFFANLSGDRSTSEKFLKASRSRQEAITSIFWNPETKQWHDYWLIGDTNREGVYQWDARHQNLGIFASNFIPLWIEAYSSDFHKDGPVFDVVLTAFQSSGLIHPAGIATSLSNTGQQWDFPNGWAPLQHMIVEGLANSGSKEALSLAKDIAERWIRTNFVTYVKTGAMHEKYDVEACGKFGGGGEYVPQTGFGWSNGVVLAFLEEFGWPSEREIGC